MAVSFLSPLWRQTIWGFCVCTYNKTKLRPRLQLTWTVATPPLQAGQNQNPLFIPKEIMWLQSLHGNKSSNRLHWIYEVIKDIVTEAYYWCNYYTVCCVEVCRESHGGFTWSKSCSWEKNRNKNITGSLVRKSASLGRSRGINPP